MDISCMRVLIVDDDKQNIESVRRGLTTQGYATEVAHSGRETIALCAGNRFHSLVMELSLPDIDGRQVCERLRESKVYTPILILSARDSVRDKVSCLRSGADDYMTKPFALEELLVRIEILTRHHAVEFEPEPKIFQIADLVLNSETHEVMRGEMPIKLTPKEYALLECFMRMPGKLLSRPQILNRVWGGSTDPLTNIVDVYIRHLRQKIDDDFERKLIKTIRGYGYKIENYGD